MTFFSSNSLGCNYVNCFTCLTCCRGPVAVTLIPRTVRVLLWSLESQALICCCLRKYQHTTQAHEDDLQVKPDFTGLESEANHEGSKIRKGGLNRTVEHDKQRDDAANFVSGMFSRLITRPATVENAPAR